MDIKMHDTSDIEPVMDWTTCIDESMGSLRLDICTNSFYGLNSVHVILFTTAAIPLRDMMAPKIPGGDQS